MMAGRTHSHVLHYHWGIGLFAKKGHRLDLPNDEGLGKRGIIDTTIGHVQSHTLLGGIKVGSPQCHNFSGQAASLPVLPDCMLLILKNQERLGLNVGVRAISKNGGA